MVDVQLACAVGVAVVVRRIPTSAGQRALRADLGGGDGLLQEDLGAGVAAVLVRVRPMLELVPRVSGRCSVAAWAVVGVSRASGVNSAAIRVRRVRARRTAGFPFRRSRTGCDLRSRRGGAARGDRSRVHPVGELVTPGDRGGRRRGGGGARLCAAACRPAAEGADGMGGRAEVPPWLLDRRAAERGTGSGWRRAPERVGGSAHEMGHGALGERVGARPAARAGSQCDASYSPCLNGHLPCRMRHGRAASDVNPSLV
jgi:hypothetical protein